MCCHHLLWYIPLLYELYYLLSSRPLVSLVSETFQRFSNLTWTSGGAASAVVKLWPLACCRRLSNDVSILADAEVNVLSSLTFVRMNSKAVVTGLSLWTGLPFYLFAVVDQPLYSSIIVVLPEGKALIYLFHSS